MLNMHACLNLHLLLLHPAICFHLLFALTVIQTLSPGLFILRNSSIHKVLDLHVNISIAITMDEKTLSGPYIMFHTNLLSFKHHIV